MKQLKILQYTCLHTLDILRGTMTQHTLKIMLQ